MATITCTLTCHGGGPGAHGLPAQFHRYAIFASPFQQQPTSSVASVVVLSAESPQIPQPHLVVPGAPADAVAAARAAIQALHPGLAYMSDCPVTPSAPRSASSVEIAKVTKGPLVAPKRSPKIGPRNPGGRIGPRKLGR